jgi:hypothetical protein
MCYNGYGVRSGVITTGENSFSDSEELGVGFGVGSGEVELIL